MGVRSGGSVAALQSVAPGTTPATFADGSARAHTPAFGSAWRSTEDACLSFDRSWRVTYVNAEAERLLRRDRAGLLGKDIWNEFPAAAGSIFEHEYRRSVAERRPVSFDAYYAPLRTWFAVRAFPSVHGLTAYFRDISADRQNPEMLADSEERFRLLSNAVTDGIWDWNLATGVLWWSDGFERLTGFSRSELAPSVASWTRRIHPDDRPRVKRSVRAALSGSTTSWSDEYRFRRKDGSYAVVCDRGSIVRGAEGKPVRMVGGVTDITLRREAEWTIRRNALRQKLIADFGMLALTTTDIAALMDRAADAVCSGLEVQFSKVVQVARDDRSRTLRAGRGWDHEWMGRRMVESREAVGEREVLTSRQPIVVEDFARETTIEPSQIMRAHAIRSAIEVPLLGGIEDAYGWIGGYSRESRAFSADDVNFMTSLAHTLDSAIERSVTQQKLAYLAQFDDLTGLPNRNVFRDRLRQMIARPGRASAHSAVMLLDLDRFKLVNDSSSHETGDALLVLVTSRLRECLRPGDTLARLGGDEFAILLTDLATSEDAGAVALKLLSALRRPFALRDTEMYVTGSIGVAVYPEDGREADVLMRNCDAAMYRAKERGRDRWEFYRPALNTRAAARLRIETRLRRIVERDELDPHFVLHYQPKIGAADGRLTGLEALLRWRDAEAGLIPPATFIPVLEQTGLILQVGQWAIRKALADYNAWRDLGLAAPAIAVNVSPEQLKRSDFAQAVRRMLRDAQVPPPRSSWS